MRRAILALAIMSTLVGAAAGQQPRLPGKHPVSPRPEGVFERQLAQIDQLIRLEHLSRANAMLEQLAGTGAPPSLLNKRHARIALALGDHERARELSLEGLAADDRDPEFWRYLAASELGLGDLDAGRRALDQFLGQVDDRRAGLTTAVDMAAAAGQPLLTIALIDSARALVNGPRFLARPRATQLLSLGRVEEASREIRAVFEDSPFNLPFVRRELLGDGADRVPVGLEPALMDLAREPGAPPELTILAANILLSRGQAAQARDLVVPLLDDRKALRAAMTNAGILVSELGVLDAGPELQAHLTYLLDLLPACSARPGLTPRRRQLALDNLAATCMVALQRGLLDDDPHAAVARFGALLEAVRDGHPESAQLYAAQIELARFTRDRLRDPAAAASRLETLLLDLDLPVEGVALARLALGESYLAARDTSRARRVLTALARDPEFRTPAGRAHYLLARLDLAQGHIATARDRFAAVALDSPGAPHANDALSLGLVIAEEMQNPTGGPDLLLRYARSVWYDLVAEPDSQRVALSRYLGRAEVQVDLSMPQPLLERARYELAVLERKVGNPGAALEQLERIVGEQPAGRMAARALALRAEILADDRLDTVAARREYERLLVQYPDYLFAGEVRQRLRDLP